MFVSFGRYWRCYVILSLLTGGLPDPRGPLSTAISSDTLTAMNRAVEEELERQKSKKRGPYQKFSPSQRSLEILNRV